MIRADRTFSAADQAWFADASGDRNPIHVDPEWAARAFPGQRVVHGAHMALWALDVLCAADPDVRIGSLQVSFLKPVFLDEAVGLEAQAGLVRLTVRGEQVAVVALDPEVSSREVQPAATVWRRGESPVDHGGNDLTGLSGQLGPDPAQAEVAVRFPALARRAAHLPAALASLSCLVGMACPGRHSLFSELRVSQAPDETGPLAFRVRRHDHRFSRVEMDVRGLGVAGVVVAFSGGGEPEAEVEESGFAPDAFAGQTPLIIGGTSGLGAVTARLLAAGGASPVVTGRRVTAPAGLEGAYLPFDAADPRGPQDLGWQGDEVYFFASPRIFRRRLEPYQAQDLRDFWSVFVDGFYETARLLLEAREGRPLSIFYPSTVAVDERPGELFEYQMAKSAGEQVCRRLAERHRSLGILIARLPRIHTRQTESFVKARADDPRQVMEPIVRRMQGGVRGVEEL